MPKYLFHGSYTQDGAKGLLKEGGSSRKAHFEQLLSGMGGKLEAFYFAFGDTDVYGIAELPDEAAAAAVSLTLAAAGGVALQTTVLIEAETIDAATKVSVGYRPPGA